MRGTIASSYENQWVIDKTTALPFPDIVLPHSDGDRMAFEIKDARKAEGDLMKIRSDKEKGHFKSFEKVEAPLSDEEVWLQWIADKR